MSTKHIKVITRNKLKTRDPVQQGLTHASRSKQTDAKQARYDGLIGIDDRYLNIPLNVNGASSASRRDNGNDYNEADIMLQSVDVKKKGKLKLKKNKKPKRGKDNVNEIDD
jgi:hypothetical protein